jgi:hypothetical protein
MNMAAPSVGRRSCTEQKRSGGLDFSKPPLEAGGIFGLVKKSFCENNVIRK